MKRISEVRAKRERAFFKARYVRVFGWLGELRWSWLGVEFGGMVETGKGYVDGSGIGASIGGEAGELGS